ncbi:hypothetical protein C8Q76DRAFT_440124 [Earliella scabrosa]|nr:hypothetical protein C8Q76DRAFT_440124 [Earliella scabrosa]
MVNVIQGHSVSTHPHRGVSPTPLSGTIGRVCIHWLGDHDIQLVSYCCFNFHPPEGRQGSNTMPPSIVLRPPRHSWSGRE